MAHTETTLYTVYSSLIFPTRFLRTFHFPQYWRLRVFFSLSVRPHNSERKYFCVELTDKAISGFTRSEMWLSATLMYRRSKVWPRALLTSTQNAASRLGCLFPRLLIVWLAQHPSELVWNFWRTKTCLSLPTIEHQSFQPVCLSQC